MDSLPRALQVEVHVQRVSPIAFGRVVSQSSRDGGVAGRRGVQTHAERWQSLTRSHVGEACVALLMPELQQVLLVQPATQLLGEILGVFSAGVECEQSVQVRKDSRTKIARPVRLR